MEHSPHLATQVIVILASYLLGCLATGYYLVRLRTGQDIRDLGSGSTGARNVSRVIGVPGYVLTLFGDVAKGGVVTWGAFQFGLGAWGLSMAIAAVVVGHVWPIQLGFRGGKGLASTLGVGLVFDFLLVIIVSLAALIVFAFTRRTTPSGLLAVVISPVVALALGHSLVTVLGIGLVVILVLIAHRNNIHELFGPEN